MAKFKNRDLVIYKDQHAIIVQVFELEDFPFVVFYKISTSCFGEIEVFENVLKVPTFDD